MKSNRMRRLGRTVENRLENLLSTPATEKAPVSLKDMAAPGPVQSIHPDQIIEDILVSTLSRVQESAAPALAAAAARYIALLRAKAV